MNNYSNKKFSFKKIIGLTILIFLISLSGIAQPLLADGGISQTICNGSSTTIGGAPTANFGSPGYTYSWAPATGLSSATVSNPTASPTTTTTYTISVTDAILTVATATLTVTVNPLPVITPAPSNVTVCNGATVASGIFTTIPGGATYTWTNSNPSIGLAASGVGFVPSFTANNVGTTPVVATITVTPTLSGCSNTPSNYTITVNPTPIGTSTPSSQTRCSGVASNFVLNSTVVGTSYTWTTTGTSVSGNTGGSGSVIAQSVSATTNLPGTATYSVTPTAAGCAGSIYLATLTVNPIPVATATSSPLTRCSGDTVSFSVSSNVSGTTFTWTASPTNVSGASPISGVGTSVFDTLSATTFSAGTVAYLFTPTAAGCTGSAIFPFVTVNPLPDVTPSPAVYPAICSGDAVAVGISSSVIGTTINWTSSEFNTSGSALSGSNVIIETLTAGAIAGATTYTLTPIASGCSGAPLTYVINVNPIPVATSTTSPLTRCSGDTASFYVSSNVAGTTFTWTSFTTNISGPDPSGIGNYIFDTLNTVVGGIGSVSYTFTPIAAGCVGSPVAPFVNVNTAPDPNFSMAVPACQYAPNAFPSVFGTSGIFSATPAGLIINPTTGEIDLTTSTPGTYDITNTITAAGGCPTVSQTFPSYLISPFVDPTITDVLPVCYGDAPFNFVAASAGGNWFGTGITNAALGTFDPTIAGPGTFTITHQSSGPCSFAYSDTTVISVIAADIYGKVTYSGGDLNSGANTAVLYNYSSSYISFDTIQVSSIDGLGYYQFSSIPSGDYLIKVFADTLVYTLLVPTYYDNEYLWDTALVMTHGCVADTANILMVEGIVGVGPGMLSGNVSEGFGFVALTADNGYARIPGEPIPGIDVKLGRNPGGQMMTNTPTDPAGNYAFTNIPINLPGQYYTVYVDIPGLGRDSVYNVTVTATDTVFTQLDYLADSNSVYPIYPVNVSVGNIAKEDVRFTVYPNPTNTNATVSYVLKTASMVKLDVYDVLGKKLESPLNTNQQAGTYKINLTQLKAGIYFVNLNINNNSNTVRLVVID